MAADKEISKRDKAEMTSQVTKLKQEAASLEADNASMASRLKELEALRQGMDEAADLKSQLKALTQERDVLAQEAAQAASDRDSLEAELTKAARDKDDLAKEVLQAQKDMLALIETAKSKAGAFFGRFFFGLRCLVGNYSLQQGISA